MVNGGEALDPVTRGGLVMVLCLSLAPVLIEDSPSPETSRQELPPGVTPEMVDRGRRVFHDVGLCHTCHGTDGTGREELGSDLTDRDWSHGDGSYEYLVDVIDGGITARESATGVPMPPCGGAGLTDAQIQAVAAYVWTLSRRSPSGGP